MDKEPKKSEHDRSSRIIGLEFRARIFGFCILEGDTKILACGVRSYGKRSALDLVGNLLDYYEPSLVVIRQWWADAGSRSSPKAEYMAGGAKVAAGLKGIECCVVDNEKFLAFYAERGCYTKYEIGSLAVEWFPELASRLPAKRRAWDGERPRALIFDALAATVACLAGR